MPLEKFSSYFEKEILFWYGVSDKGLIKRSVKCLDWYLKNLRKDLHCLVEYPYVDRTYRSTYYHYFSSKNDSYHRDSVRVTFYDDKIDPKDFRHQNKRDLIQKNFRGFITIRPTFPYVIGRSVMSKEMLLDSEISTCATQFRLSVLGLELEVEGFPHSSQDTEYMTCGETAIWAMAEFYGTKYPEFVPGDPGKINEIVQRISFERIKPSNGLSIQEMSYVLREFGMETKIYDHKAYSSEFLSILKIYVESKMPILVFIDGSESTSAHVAIVIGRRGLNHANSKREYLGSKVLGIGAKKELFSCNLDYILIDDNLPGYTSADLRKISDAYKITSNVDSPAKGAKITKFVVPFGGRVYLRAEDALNRINLVLEDYGFRGKLWKRMFLRSGGSVKDHVVSSNIGEDFKTIILGISMPKFVWVMEVCSEKKTVEQNLIDGLIVLDATEPRKKGVLFALIANTYLRFEPIYDDEGRLATQFKEYLVPLQAFESMLV